MIIIDLIDYHRLVGNTIITIIIIIIIINYDDDNDDMLKCMPNVTVFISVWEKKPEYFFKI